MPDPSKWIAGAMVGITIVVIVVGAIVLKTMLAEPASACGNLRRLNGGDKVVEQLQRYLEAHGTHETGSCNATVEALGKTLGPDQAKTVNDCLMNAKTADAAGHCI